MPDFFDTLWFFIRGDMPTIDFEKWVYDSVELENRMGPEFYMDIISTDYSKPGPVYVLKDRLRQFAQKNKNYDCACITLADLDDIGMGEEEYAFKSFTKEKSHGEPYWWLSMYQCNVCNQEWMVAQEERINDVFILKRITSETALEIRDFDNWPDDFIMFGTLLQTGHERGHNCRFIDPLSPALTATVVDLALESPGIKISEIATLLAISDEWATHLCNHVLEKEEVEIDTSP